MSPSTRSRVKLTVSEVEKAIGPIEGYAGHCHGASLALVRSGLLPAGSRVARGFAKGVGSQHSWALVAPQTTVYDSGNQVVDLTLWSYVPSAPRLYTGAARRWPHIPHGYGELRQLVTVPMGPKIKLEGELSSGAKLFLEMWAPGGLDYQGWAKLMNGPMQGWPSKEIVTAAYRTPGLKRVIPIDIVGMLTDENPGGLYF